MKSNTEITKIEDSREIGNKSKTKGMFIPSPKQLYQHLNDYVIGQDDAKKTLAVAIYNHFKRFMINVYGVTKNVKSYEKYEDVFIEKSNVLILGNSGTGKTYMVKTLCNFLNIPCYIADSTKLTESGYVGDDVENILVGLLKSCDYNIEMAQCGVVVLDEIDKLSRKGENVSITRDVGGEGVQQGLLKIVEGGIISVPPQGGRKHPQQKCIDIDTTNILFIALGAFEGIERVIEKRLNTNRIGFNTTQTYNKDNDILSNVDTADIRQYGLIPELLGRFPIITHTNPLTEDDMIKILSDTKNSAIRQYQKLMSVDNINLDFTENALRTIAHKAIITKTGARGLKKIIENVLMNIMFEFGGNTEKTDIIIDEDFINNELGQQEKVA